MAKYIITGGDGFIGTHLKNTLPDCEVLDMKSGTNIVTDKLDFTRADYVIHLAAWGRIPKCLEDPLGAYYNNVIGSVRVLEECRRAKVKKVVLASSCAVNALETPYKTSKKAMEDIARVYRETYDLPTVSLRLANVYGKGIDENDSLLFAQIKRDGVAKICGDGTQTRDWIHVDDIIRALVQFAGNKAVGEIDIATGINTSVNYIADLLGVKKEYLPERQGDVMYSRHDTSEAKKWGYEAKIPLKEGINNI